MLLGSGLGVAIASTADVLNNGLLHALVLSEIDHYRQVVRHLATRILATIHILIQLIPLSLRVICRRLYIRI